MNHALVNTFINVLNAANRAPFLLIVQQNSIFSVSNAVRVCVYVYVLFVLNEMFTQASAAIPRECNINVSMSIRRS